MKSIFQQPEFYKFLESTGFFEPFRYFVERDGKEVGVIQGFIQKDGGLFKQFLSRRAIINGGPWLAEDITVDEVEKLLKKCIEGLKKKAIYIETRNYIDFSNYKHIFEKTGFVYEPHYDFIVDTSSVEVMESNMGKSRKRDVNASIKQGVTIVDNPIEAEVTEFYAILEELYRKKVKTPLFSKDFFLKLWSAPFSKFILVKFQDKIIGGTVCICDDEAVYEWFACGKDGVYKNVFPSTVATYYGIRFAADNSFRKFDMMGAGAPGDGGYGVREFKAKFGGELVEYGRFKYICNKSLYTFGEFGVTLLKKLK